MTALPLFNKADGTVTISIDDYNDLKDSELFLTCLSDAGVDNWPGYEIAQEEYQAMRGDND